MESINFVGVLLSAVGAMAVGFLWYSPMLFGNKWMKLMGYTAASMKKDKNNMGMYYGMSMVLSIVSAVVLSMVMRMSASYFDSPLLENGIASGFWMWLGFVMPTQATGVIFSNNKNWMLFGINTGYQLASLVVMGAIVGLLG